MLMRKTLASVAAALLGCAVMFALPASSYCQGASSGSHHSAKASVGKKKSKSGAKKKSKSGVKKGKGKGKAKSHR